MYTAKLLLLIMLKILNIKFISEDKYVFFSDLYSYTNNLILDWSCTNISKLMFLDRKLLHSIYTSMNYEKNATA